jgi:hypothetical protein
MSTDTETLSTPAPILELPPVRGRRVPPRPRHLFADSGEEVEIHPLSPYTFQRIAETIRKEAERPGHTNPRPQPPVQQVDIAGEQRAERNETDPVFQARLAAWNLWVAGEMNERALRIAAADNVVPLRPLDEVRALAQRVRRRLAAEGVELPVFAAYDEEENDRIVYVLHICLGSKTDMQEFYRRLTERAAVTPAQVEAATATFRPADTA